MNALGKSSLPDVDYRIWHLARAVRREQLLAAVSATTPGYWVPHRPYEPTERDGWFARHGRPTIPGAKRRRSTINLGLGTL